MGQHRANRATTELGWSRSAPTSAALVVALLGALVASAPAPAVAMPLPVVVPGSGSVVEGDGAPTVLALDVTISQATDVEVTVQWATIHEPAWSPTTAAMPGVDYQASSGEVVFQPGADLVETVEIPIDGDALHENGELVVVWFHSPTNATMGGFWGLGFGGITDDDAPPTVEPGTATVGEGDSGTTEVGVPLSLSAPSGLDATVEWTTLVIPGSFEPSATPDVDYATASGEVTFTAGQTDASVTVEVNGDTDVEDDERFLIQLSGAVDASIGGFFGLGSVLIEDDDLPSNGDADGDGVPDAQDNCPAVANADQGDHDRDGAGDFCDPDSTDGPDGDADNDGLTNDEEAALGTDPGNPDTDGDGSPDGAEVDFGTDPLVDDQFSPPINDSDGDYVADLDDNCPSDPNSAQADVDGDGTGDACDGDPDDGPGADPDGDGLTNAEEVAAGTDGTDPDTDDDGSLDGTEIVVGTNPLAPDTEFDTVLDGADNCPLRFNIAQLDEDRDGLGDACDFDPERDGDNDRLTDGQEVNVYGTDPDDPDTDGDLELDGFEVYGWHTDPTDPDTDGDGVEDGLEMFPDRRGVPNVRDKFTDPLQWDTDGDGLGDGEEWDLFGIVSPVAFDSDFDGVGDGLELALNMNPFTGDGDGDGLSDGLELSLGTIPVRNDSDGDWFPDGTEAPGGILISDPTDPDSWPRSERNDVDGDGIDDGSDNCPPEAGPGPFPFVTGSNPSQLDIDLDGVGAVCDDDIPGGQFRFDSDADGVRGIDELAIGLDANSSDSDNDSVIDGIELRFGSNPTIGDTDADGRTDFEEWTFTGNVPSFPTRVDSEGDGLDDRVEVDVHGTNPRSHDTDFDGLTDADEINIHGTDPTVADTDGDGLLDGPELGPWGTDPLDPDSDDDGHDDGEEADEGSDPNDPDSTPGPGPNPVVIEGSVNWEAFDTTMHPVRHAPVFLEEEVDGNTFEVYGEAVTDEFGNFEMEIDPDDFPDEFSEFVRLRVEARWEGRFDVLNSADPEGKPHEMIEPLTGPFSAGALLLPDIEITEDLGFIQDAFSIHAAGVAGATFVENEGLGVGPVDYQYPAAAPPLPVGTDYGGGLVRITPDDSSDLDVILHEFGHHIAAEIGFDASAGGEHNWCATTAGAPTGVVLRRQAWSEGVATFLGIAISREVPALTTGFEGAGNASFDEVGAVPYSLEVGCSGSVEFGMTDEGTVAAFLWDLYDDNVDLLGFDSVLEDVTIDIGDLISWMDISQTRQFHQFYRQVVDERVGGDPFEAAFDVEACAAQEAGAVPTPRSLNHTVGGTLALSTPMRLELLIFPQDFVADNTPVRVSVHDGNDLLLYETTVLAGDLPRSDGASSGSLDDPRVFEFEEAAWSFIASAQRSQHRFTVGTEIGGDVVRGCAVEFEGFVP